MSDDQIDTALAAGSLLPVHRGVFAVGHRAIGRRGRMHAAVLASGPDAAISHLTAAELHGLTDRGPATIDVLAAGQAGRRIQGIRRHRTRRILSGDITAVDHIPCTTVSRSLVDCAGFLGTGSLRGLVEEAAVRRSLNAPEIDRILARGRRRGARQLRVCLAPWLALDRPPRLRSRLEARLLRELVERGFPPPATNVTLRLAGSFLEVDFLWERGRVILEADGRQTHDTSAAFRRDRWRDQVLGAAGYRVSRVTWDQLEDEPEAVFSRIRRMLGS